RPSSTPTRRRTRRWRASSAATSSAERRLSAAKEQLSTGGSGGGAPSDTTPSAETATERSEGAAQHRVAWRVAPPETTRALRPRPSAAKEQLSTGWPGGSPLQKQHER